MMFNPNLLPESADPIGSVRYKCLIIKLIGRGHYSLNFEDYLEEANTLVVKYLSPNNPIFRVEIFDGIALKERNNRYSYWKDIRGGEG